MVVLLLATKLYINWLINLKKFLDNCVLNLGLRYMFFWGHAGHFSQNQNTIKTIISYHCQAKLISFSRNM